MVNKLIALGADPDAVHICCRVFVVCCASPRGGVPGCIGFTASSTTTPILVQGESDFRPLHWCCSTRPNNGALNVTVDDLAGIAAALLEAGASHAGNGDSRGSPAYGALCQDDPLLFLEPLFASGLDPLDLVCADLVAAAPNAATVSFLLDRGCPATGRLNGETALLCAVADCDVRASHRRLLCILCVRGGGNGDWRCARC